MAMTSTSTRCSMPASRCACTGSPTRASFATTTSKHRDLAALLLLDISESTRDRLASGSSILDVERLAVAVLAEAMGALGDPFSLLAFASNGRDDVEMTTVKGVGDEPYDRACIGAAIAALSPGLSTRLGARIRHAGDDDRTGSIIPAASSSSS
jgi:nitric oxide reductase NorD protein